MQHSVKSGHLYRNALTNQLFFVMGVYPHLKNKKVPDTLKAFVVILTEVFPENTGDKVLSHVTLEEFEKIVKVPNGEDSVRFIRVINSDKKDNLKHLLTEFDEEVTDSNSKIKKIKFIK